MVVEIRWCSSLSFERNCHFRCGSITVRGSSNMITLTSSRASPRPSEIFCFPSAVRPAARRPSISVRSVISAIASTRCLTWSSATPRLRRGKGQIVEGQSWCRRRPETGKTCATLRMSGGSAVTSLSSNRMRPSLGRNRPEMMLRSVVFPQPDGPKQGVSAAVLEDGVEMLQRVIVGRLWPRLVAVPARRQV